MISAEHLEQLGIDNDTYMEYLKTMQEQIDPRQYLAPSMREVAMMTMEQLETENNLVVAKQSTRSRAQRDLIQSRWEYEQITNKPNEETIS
jgi:hypothetical protein